jgi:hypothetical protein
MKKLTLVALLLVAATAFAADQYYWTPGPGGVQGQFDFNSDAVPVKNHVSTLGASAKHWRYLYVDTIYGTTTITDSTIDTSKFLRNGEATSDTNCNLGFHNAFGDSIRAELRGTWMTLDTTTAKAHFLAGNLTGTWKTMDTTTAKSHFLAGNLTGTWLTLDTTTFKAHILAGTAANAALLQTLDTTAMKSHTLAQDHRGTWKTLDTTDMKSHTLAGTAANALLLQTLDTTAMKSHTLAQDHRGTWKTLDTTDMKSHTLAGKAATAYVSDTTLAFRNDSAHATVAYFPRLRGDGSNIAVYDDMIRLDKATAWGDSVSTITGNKNNAVMLTKYFRVTDTLKATPGPAGGNRYLFTIPGADTLVVKRVQVYIDSFSITGAGNDSVISMAVGDSNATGAAILAGNEILWLKGTILGQLTTPLDNGWSKPTSTGTALQPSPTVYVPFYNVASNTKVYFNYGGTAIADGKLGIRGKVLFEVASNKIGAW